MKSNYLLLILLGLILVGFTSCEDDGDEATPTTEELLQGTWAISTTNPNIVVVDPSTGVDFTPVIDDALEPSLGGTAALQSLTDIYNLILLGSPTTVTNTFTLNADGTVTEVVADGSVSYATLGQSNVTWTYDDTLTTLTFIAADGSTVVNVWTISNVTATEMTARLNFAFSADDPNNPGTPVFTNPPTFTVEANFAKN